MFCITHNAQIFVCELIRWHYTTYSFSFGHWGALVYQFLINISFYLLKIIMQNSVQFVHDESTSHSIWYLCHFFISISYNHVKTTHPHNHTRQMIPALCFVPVWYLSIVFTSIDLVETIATTTTKQSTTCAYLIRYTLHKPVCTKSMTIVAQYCSLLVTCSMMITVAYYRCMVFFS